MLRTLLHAGVILFLTLVTQIGGLAWLVSRLFQRKLLAFVALYAGLSLATLWVAPSFGRVALSCSASGPLQVQSWMYCALNRSYVSQELAEVLADTAEEMDKRFPGTQTLVLDANFPFFEGFPLLPHLSHDDGEKADIAFYYENSGGYLPGATRSPIGYFAFEEGPTDCRQGGPSLRWNLRHLQPLWADYTLDQARNQAVLQILAGDARVGKIFVEPHLVQKLGVAHAKIRFQGCRAARHDDHIHLQIK